MTSKEIGSPQENTSGACSIAAVERDTGIGKDTLRVWERRYGFPQPLRDELGERLYPPEQVDRLLLIKRLMDQGQRPGKIVPASIEELRQRLADERPTPKVGAGDTASDWLIERLRRNETELLRHELAQRMAREGLQRFVCHTVPELNHRIGEGWLSGEIQIFEEHVYTEVMQNLLRASILSLPRSLARPHVLLTTLKDEEHLLGLLMAETLLTAEGAWCLSLGAQTPVADIIGAAQATATDIVALSFSSAYPWRKARDGLLELRAGLPAETAVWAGGGCLARQAKLLPGITCFAAIEEIITATGDWRTAHTN
jgi:DNA-binding transcriptional MerR regulator/methylmalonyl-CoA mutase cobalamin-binding subunit